MERTKVEEVYELITRDGAVRYETMFYPLLEGRPRDPVVPTITTVLNPFVKQSFSHTPETETIKVDKRTYQHSGIRYAPCPLSEDTVIRFLVYNEISTDEQ